MPTGSESRLDFADHLVVLTDNLNREGLDPVHLAMPRNSNESL